MEALKFFRERMHSFPGMSHLSVELLVDSIQKMAMFKPNEIILDFGKVEKYLYFIVSGDVRLFVIDPKNEAINIGFAYEGTFLTSFQSFIDGTPSGICLETISACEIILLPKSRINELLNLDQSIADWYRVLIEKNLAGHIQRQIELLTLPPADRYKAFLQRSGKLLNRIPLKQIASYLHMSAETLSRIRSNIS